MPSTNPLRKPQVSIVMSRRERAWLQKLAAKYSNSRESTYLRSMIALAAKVEFPESADEITSAFNETRASYYETNEAHFSDEHAAALAATIKGE